MKVFLINADSKIPNLALIEFCDYKHKTIPKSQTKLEETQ